VVFVSGVAAHAARANGRHNTVLRDFVTTALASLPPNSIVMTNMGDDVNGAVAYFHEVERLRPDIVHLDRYYLSTPWGVARERRLHRDVVLPEGVYRKDGWRIEQLLDANSGRPFVVIGPLDEWDTTWQEAYSFLPHGLVNLLVRASEVPSYEQWTFGDRRAMGTYDVTAALRAPDDSWENGLGQRVLDIQVARAHVALAWASERADAVGPARFAQQLLEDVVAKTGGDAELGIAAWPGLRKAPTGSGVWKNLGLAYQVLSRVDTAYVTRFAVACERFVQRADGDDPDLPAARAYLAAKRKAPRR
jgi:hypothetical protein